MKRLAILVVVAALPACGGFNLGGISSSDVLKAGSAVAQSQRQYTPDEERAIGRVVAARILGTYPLWEDNVRTRYLNLVGQTAARQVGRAGTVWRFALLDTESVNAYSCPGGYVFVTRGLLQSCHTEAELAAVVGHECGHVAGEHVLSAIKRANLVGAGISIVADHAGGGGLSADLMRKIGETGYDALISRGLDRKDEFDADARGCRIAHGAGYATTPYAEFLRRLQQRLAGESGGALANLSKTHPSPSDRLKELGDKGLIFADGRILAERFGRLGR